MTANTGSTNAPVFRTRCLQCGRPVTEEILPLLRRLAKVDPPVGQQYGGLLTCLLCTAVEGDAHDKDCPWRQARELLGIPLEAQL